MQVDWWLQPKKLCSATPSGICHINEVNSTACSASVTGLRGAQLVCHTFTFTYTITTRRSITKFLMTLNFLIANPVCRERSWRRLRRGHGWRWNPGSRRRLSGECWNPVDGLQSLSNCCARSGRRVPDGSKLGHTQRGLLNFVFQ